MQTSKEFLRIFLDMGEALLSSGAEIFRVEDTLNRMGYACGATQMNVFVITSSIVITMEFPGEGARTQTRRIRESGGNDFTKLEQLNDLSRRFCNHPVPAAELKKEFDEMINAGASSLFSHHLRLFMETQFLYQLMRHSRPVVQLIHMVQLSYLLSKFLWTYIIQILDSKFVF